MKTKKFNFQMKQSIFNMFNLFIGFILSAHFLSSWLVSRISYTSFISEVNWFIILCVLVGGLIINFLIIRMDKEKGKNIVKALALIGMGGLIMSIYFLIRVNL